MIVSDIGSRWLLKEIFGALHINIIITVFLMLDTKVMVYTTHSKRTQNIPKFTNRIFDRKGSDEGSGEGTRDEN